MRATSPTMAGIWPFWLRTWTNSLGSMPYCAAPCTRYWVSSSWLTWTFSASAIASSTIWVLKALVLDSVTSARCSSSSRRPSDSRWRCTSSSMTLSATGTSASSTSLSTSRSRAWVPWPNDLLRATCSLRLAVSSSSVSNSLAICAKSSSASGSSRSLTAVTVTVISAVSPSWSPPRSFDSKVVVSPAVSESRASSMPSSSSPEPSSYEMPLAVSTSVSSMTATRSRVTKSPVLAGRSTVMSVPKRLRRRSSSSATSSSPTSTESTVSSRPS